MNVAQVLSELHVKTNSIEKSLSKLSNTNKYKFCQHIRRDEVLISSWIKGAMPNFTAQFLIKGNTVEIDYGDKYYKPEVLREMKDIIDKWLLSDLHV